jgi:hypothetical protein
MKSVPQAQWKLSPEEIVAILKAERDNSLGSGASSDLSQQRIQSLNYYMGDMTDTMPSEDGRSGAISTDVQDVIEGVLPILLDVFIGGEKVVEFKPTSADDEAQAKQETDAINHVFMQENDGFLILYSVLKDALTQKNGFAKWWVEENEDRNRENYSGLTADAYAAIVADKNVEIVKKSAEVYDGNDELTGQPAKFYNCAVETTKKTKRYAISAVPPEEILVSKSARGIRESGYLAHVSQKPMADILATFPDHKEVIEAAPGAQLASDNSEAIERQTVQDSQDGTQNTDTVNTGMRLIEIVEHSVRMALEKDGIARKYLITTIGTKYDILQVEALSNWRLATGTPIINPHRLFGRSLADLTIDIQEIKTSLIRATLDNAYYANNQRIEVSEAHAGENTIEDLLNNRVGGLVRTKMPGGINPLPAQPIGSWVMNTIEYFDSVKENRTGVSRYNQGLDADSLNHTATGVTAIMNAAEMRVKLMARIFAETFFVDLFRGLHELIQENGEEAFDIQLRDTWVTIDPREWKKRKHMTVKLPVGGIGKQQMIAFFSKQLEVQNAAIAQQGGGNGPLVSYQNIYNTLDKLVQLGGAQSVTPFFMNPGAPTIPAPPKPDSPEMMLAKAKVTALQAQTANKMHGDIASQQQSQQADAAQQQFEQQQDAAKAQHDRQRDIDNFAHKGALDKMKFDHETAMEQLKVGAQMRLEAFKAQEKAQLEREKMEHAATLNAQQAKLDAKTGDEV